MIVMVCAADFGPAQPAAVAVMMLVPLHPAAKVTSPVAVFIVLPPDVERASMSYVIPVLLDAVAVYVVLPAL